MSNNINDIFSCAQDLINERVNSQFYQLKGDKLKIMQENELNQIT